MVKRQAVWAQILKATNELWVAAVGLLAYTLKTTVEKNSTLSSTPLLSCDSATLVLRKSVEELTQQLL